MTQRVIRKTGIQFKLETTYGTNPGSWAATDFLQIKDASFNIDRDLVPRGLIRPYLGTSEDLIGTRKATVKFTAELAGSGTKDVAPAWGKLLRACGFAETVVTGSRVEYTPISDAMESASMRYFIDGIMFVSVGVRATGMLRLNAYGIPEIEIEAQGYDTAASELSLPSTNFSAWKAPIVITDANSADIRFGGAYSAGAITGGTVYPSKGLEIDLGNTLTHQKILGGEAIKITDRNVSGSCTVAMTAATENTWRTDLNANTMTSCGFKIGTADGYKLAIFGGNVQRVNPTQVDDAGSYMVKTDLKFVPTAAGNDLIIASL